MRLRRRGRRPRARRRRVSTPRRVRAGGATRTIRAKAVVLAAGGFEVEPRMAARGVGRAPPTTSSSAARRTTRARCCRLMLDAGAQPVGDRARVPRGRDRRARAEVRRRHRHAARLRVARHRRQPHAERFYDEGEDFWPKRYAIWGSAGRAAARPDRVLDHRRQGGRPLHAVGVSADRRRARSASSRRMLESAGRAARGDRRRLQRAVRPGTFDHAVLDDCRTDGLDARRRRTGRSASTRRRICGYPLRPGITFTYLGVKVDDARARADAGRRARATTSTPPARSWPATSCARATSPASA